MRIITLNLNGIRSAVKKGAFRWLAEQNADIICLQEIRANAQLIESDLFRLGGYHCFYLPAQKGGYSGVAIFSKNAPDRVVNSLEFPLADEEGRYIHMEFGNLIVASLYMPSGTSGDARQALKYEFMEKFEHTLERYIKTQKSYIICGDWNIAHKNIDLKNWRANQKRTGFLPEERAWLDKLFDQIGFVDGFRVVNQEPDQYTWWSNFAGAWANNVGWRIDYQIISPDLKDKVKGASIYRGEKFSDHAPLVMDYDL